MLQLRCTAKVIKLLGLKPGDLSEIKISESLLGNWYVNRTGQLIKVKLLSIVVKPFSL